MNDVEVIDMRLRPAVPSLTKSVLYQGGESAAIGKTLHPDFPRAPSTRERSIERLIEEMDAANVVTGSVPGRHSMEPFGVVSNEEISALAVRYPGRFVGWMGLDLRDNPDRWIAAIRAWAGRPGIVGVSIEPAISLEPDIGRADDRRLYPIYEECVKQRIPVSITLSALLQRMTGRPYELSDPKPIYRVAVDFPSLDIVVAHGAYPWVNDMLGVAFVCTNVWVSPDIYMTPQWPGAREYALAANDILQDRVLYGSNYPARPFPQHIAAYRSWGWKDGVIEKVLSRNARRLMSLE
ncbi:MAG: amidohydrolase family protein [Lautropia sp.]